MNKNQITWIILMALTSLSYFFGESESTGYFIAALMIIAFVKCGLVGFQFMDLNSTQLFWKVSFIGLAGIFVLLILVFTLI